MVKRPRPSLYQSVNIRKIFKGNINSIKNYIHVKDAAKYCFLKLKKRNYAGGFKLKKMITIIQRKFGKEIIVKSNKDKKTSEIVITNKIFKIKPLILFMIYVLRYTWQY